MIELNLTRKRLLQIILERRFRWGKPHRRPFHSLPTDSAPHSKKKRSKSFHFWSVFFGLFKGLTQRTYQKI